MSFNYDVFQLFSRRYCIVPSMIKCIPLEWDWESLTLSRMVWNMSGAINSQASQYTSQHFLFTLTQEEQWRKTTGITIMLAYIDAWYVGMFTNVVHRA